MPKKKEIERRFLIGNFLLYDDIAYNIAKMRFRNVYITQGYILDEKGTRLRSENENGVVKYFRTWKKGEGVEREEDEMEISKEYFLRRWKKIACFLIKERHFIKLENIKQTFKLNFFEYYVGGVWQNFWLIEVEFESLKESQTFVPPISFGKEVTDDERYNGHNLARYGLLK